METSAEVKGDRSTGTLNEESIDPVGAIQSDHPGRQTENVSRHGGEHGGVRGEATRRELEVTASEEGWIGSSPFQV